MTEDPDLRRRAHELDATVRAGKGGVESIAPELERQLEDADLVKVKFLRAARTDPTDELAADLAERVGAALVETRGHTAVYRS